MPEIKTVKLGLKRASADGSGECVFATTGVIDHDNDYTEPNAFFGNPPVKICGSHNWNTPNFGYAKIREEGHMAIGEFQFYLDIPEAKAWHTSILENFKAGIGQEWSYAFEVLDSGYGSIEGRQVRILKKLLVFEISPVLRGAGLNTETLSVKNCPHCKGASNQKGNDPPASLTLKDRLQKLAADAVEVGDWLHSIDSFRGDQGRVLPRELQEQIVKVREQFTVLEARGFTKDLRQVMKDRQQVVIDQLHRDHLQNIAKWDAADKRTPHC